MPGIVKFKTQFDMVEEFHQRAGMLPNNPLFPPTEGVIKRRVELIREEVLNELLPALEALEGEFTEEMQAKILDGLVDAVYVILGTAWELGLPFDVGFELAHVTNIAKIEVPGKPILREDGKILKPEGWQPPNFLHLIAQYKNWLSTQQALQAGTRNASSGN